jgi:hypothetical protein
LHNVLLLLFAGCGSLPLASLPALSQRKNTDSVSVTQQRDVKFTVSDSDFGA